MAHPARLYQTHEERTAAEPRRDGLHSVVVKQVDKVNDNVRLLRLKIVDEHRGIEFRPGQWLDVFVPGIIKAGGFTITSTPYQAQPVRDHPERHTSDRNTRGERLWPYVELAIQKSPRNPPAAWLWQDPENIKNTLLNVRVGGSFVWPPAGIEQTNRRKVILTAGGVGINPLISILSHLHVSNEMPQDVVLLYASKSGRKNDGSDILFLPRIQQIARARPHQLAVKLFLTDGNKADWKPEEPLFNTSFRRVSPADIDSALGDVGSRAQMVCYVCGPQIMTDTFVDAIRAMEGVPPDHVLCEKWW